MDVHSFMYFATLLLVVSALTVSISKRLGLGDILGLLMTGVLLGPHVIGVMLPSQVDAIRSFTELGVVFLLFLIGLEIHPRHLWEMRKSLFGLGGLQILISGSCLSVFVLLMGFSLTSAIVIGSTLALSSTAFVVQMLKSKGELSSEHGKTAFAVLLMQDIAVVPLLAMMPLLSQAETSKDHIDWKLAILSFSMVVGVILIGRFVVPFLMHHLAKSKNREGFFLVALSSMFVAATAFEKAGLSMGLGAFLMGMMLSMTKYSFQVETAIEPYKGMLMSVFFVAVGMSINPHVIIADYMSFSILLLGMISINIVVMFILCILFGQSRASAIKAAFLLCQGGEFGFVIFGAAKSDGLLTDNQFALCVAIISLTMLLTPALIKFGYSIANKLMPDMEGVPSISSHSGEPRVIISGYGRMGHAIGTILNHRNVPFVAFDSNPEVVAQWRKQGHPIFYGDTSNPALFQRGDLEKSELLILTIDDSQKVLRVATEVKIARPHLKIVARARDLSMCDQLAGVGVESSIPETLEPSLRMAEEAFQLLGEEKNEADAFIESIRINERSSVNRETE